MKTKLLLLTLLIGGCSEREPSTKPYIITYKSVTPSNYKYIDKEGNTNYFYDYKNYNVGDTLK